MSDSAAAYTSPPPKRQITVIWQSTESSPYPILSSFCMKDCFYTVLGAGNANYSPLLDDAEKYFNDGIPLFIITFTDSDITFGILVDVSTFEPGEPEPW